MLINTQLNWQELEFHLVFKLNQEEFLRLVSDIAEKVILIRLLEWLLEFEVKKKKRHAVISFYTIW